jgi:uncharacterized repeat protein (TIGR01451 family)
MQRLSSFLLLLIAVPAFADRFVAPGGVDNGICNGAPPCATINHAIGVAAAGETIHVAAGTYAERVNVNKQLTLLGAQAGIDARTRSGAESIINQGAGETAFNISASNVVIDGFTAEGATSSTTFGFGILVDAGISGAQILNTIIQNNIAGISLANTGVSQLVLRHNLVQNNNQPGPISGTGIYSDQFSAGGVLSNVLIEENTFDNNANVGVLIGPTTAASATGITIQRNSFTNNGNAVLLFNTVNTAVADNFASGSTGSTIVLGGGNDSTSVTGNVIASGATRGIRVGDFGGGNPFGTLSIHHNSIVNTPTAAIDNDASGPALLTAENNWFGCNAGPGQPGCTAVVGSVDADPWLVLTISAPATVQVGQSIPVVVSLRTNSNGVDTTAQGDIADNLLNVNFSALQGSISPAFALMVASLANATFTGTVQGNASASGTLHSQTVTTQIVVTGVPNSTSVTSSNNPSHVGQNVTFTATITPSTPGPVPTGTATFTIDGVPGAPIPLNGAGQATFSTSSLTGGTHPVTASYSGDSTYVPSTSATLQQVVQTPTAVSATKAASGTFSNGSTVTYTVVLTNSGTTPQADNPGNEFVDILPAGLTLVSATATSGTTVANVGTNTVTFNGSIPASGSVTITINTTINGTQSTITNQGTVNFDADGNGTNESSAQTDDPSTPAPGDATTFQVAVLIPTLSPYLLLLLAGVLAFTGVKLLRL